MMTHGFLVIASSIKSLLISEWKMRNLIIYSSLSVCLSVYQVEELAVANWQGKGQYLRHQTGVLMMVTHTTVIIHSSLSVSVSTRKLRILTIFSSLSVCLSVYQVEELAVANWQGKGQCLRHQTGVLMMVTHTTVIIHSSLSVSVSTRKLRILTIFSSLSVCLSVYQVEELAVANWQGKGQCLRHQTGVLMMVTHTTVIIHSSLSVSVSTRKLRILTIFSSLSVCLSVYQVEELAVANWQGKGQYLRHQTGVLVMVIHTKCYWKWHMRLELIYDQTAELYSATQSLHWSLQSEKTLFMSTPKHPGDQIFRFTRVKLTMNPLIWNCKSTEWTLHCSMSPMRAHLKQSTNKNI